MYGSLDNAAGDQAGNMEEFQYYNADADVGACIAGDHWVSFLIESNLLCPPTRTSTPLVYMYLGTTYVCREGVPFS